MRTSELDFDLPRALVATAPASPRDAARMLVVSRSDPSVLEHRLVRDLPHILAPGDRLVFNATRVLPARFRGVDPDTGGRAEGLYLRDHDDAWVALVRARRLAPGKRIDLTDHAGAPAGVRLTLLERSPDDDGAWRLAVEGTAEPAPLVLDRLGLPPLPPYVLGARRDRGEPEDRAPDRADYQTVFAPPSSARPSVAAPTAGLHFTPALLAALDQRRVERAQVELAVGPGTFKPVEADSLADHPMHAEWCTLAPAGPRVLDPAPGRLIAVGTTTVRTLESFAALRDAALPAPDWLATRLLIAPGHRWRAVEGVLTNFHLPRSTLLALVAALFDDGIDRVRALYAHAIDERYRFFSFGDAMLILP